MSSNNAAQPTVQGAFSRRSSARSFRCSGQGLVEAPALPAAAAIPRNRSLAAGYYPRRMTRRLLGTSFFLLLATVSLPACADLSSFLGDLSRATTPPAAAPAAGPGTP